jgi:predicted MPP superfamily phosphohydrolase
MEITLSELKERLASLDEVTLMEILDIHSDELVEAFEDRIEEEQSKLKRMMNE